ncbi:MAG: YraN family protein [Paracoccaceae bacterium]
MSGLVSYHAGLAAEDSVARLYEGSGHTVAARRWRGQSGEIDLIARDGDVVIFIEVKQSHSHTEAALHLTPQQFQRIYYAAEEFIAGEPKGSLTDVRFDVALVDAAGRIEILENAYAA